MHTHKCTHRDTDMHRDMHTHTTAHSETCTHNRTHRDIHTMTQRQCVYTHLEICMHTQTQRHTLSHSLQLKSLHSVHLVRNAGCPGAIGATVPMTSTSSLFSRLFAPLVKKVTYVSGVKSFSSHDPQSPINTVNAMTLCY